MLTKRPELDNKISVTDFKDFYWLKNELIDFCKSTGICTNGGKQALADRIISYLHTGEIPKNLPKQPSKSKFDWKTAEITLDAEITDNYRNSENVRAFMKREIGAHFRFNTEFLKWTKQNVGKTMKDAIHYWRLKRNQRGDNVYTKSDLRMTGCETAT